MSLVRNAFPENMKSLTTESGSGSAGALVLTLSLYGFAAVSLSSSSPSYGLFKMGKYSAVLPALYANPSKPTVHHVSNCAPDTLCKALQGIVLLFDTVSTPSQNFITRPDR
eukprot:3930936-Rhodomonas_salina.2